MRKCRYRKCMKKLKPHPNQKIVPKNRNYCDATCRSRECSLVIYYKLRNDPEYKAMKSKVIKDWYKTHKKQQLKNVNRNYYQNKSIWVERKYITVHRDKFLKLINQKCPECGQSVKIVHHMTYGFKRNWKSRGAAGTDPFNLWEYAQFLTGFCSKKCHCAYHRKQRDKPEFVSLENVYNNLKTKLPLDNQAGEHNKRGSVILNDEHPLQSK